MKLVLEIDLPRSANILNSFLYLWKIKETDIPTCHWINLGWDLIGLRRNSKIPKLCRCFGSYCFIFFKLNQRVKVIGEAPSGLPSLGFDLSVRMWWGWASMPWCYDGFLMEAISISSRLKKKKRFNPLKIPVALAPQTLLVCFRFPVTGGSRSAVNDAAIAESGVASILMIVIIIVL